MHLMVSWIIVITVIKLYNTPLESQSKGEIEKKWFVTYVTKDYVNIILPFITLDTIIQIKIMLTRIIYILWLKYCNIFDVHLLLGSI